jgi:5-methyltetrahydrofolate--homocysteine methyltransferase
MTISADQTSANTALEALHYLRYTMGCNTVLGVSNISFGLPNRDLINGTFFAMALTNGLSAAILNPNSQEMLKTYKSYLALSGKDANCLGYIAYAPTVSTAATQAQTGQAKGAEDHQSLQHCIIRGLREEAGICASDLLKTTPPLEVINSHIIPALNVVGKGFEEKTMFLPQLLMSAEAASAAFEVIKTKFSGAQTSKKVTMVLATVKGDIHDIGKNIVKTVCENYGFTVYDMGRDVPPEAIVEKVQQTGAQAVGLSALMTTTVPSMQATIALLKQTCPQVKTLVGGAVLTPAYAATIGADYYCKDALATVRALNELEETINKE